MISPISSDGLEFVDRPYDQRFVAFLELAPGLVDVLRGETLVDLAEGESQPGQLRFVDFHLDFFYQPALDADRSDARHRFKLPPDLPVRQVPQHDQVVSGQPQTHDRIEFRVVPQEYGTLGVLGQEHAVYPFPHVHDGQVHVRVPIELEHHVGDARPGDGTDFHQTGNDPHVLFDPPGDEVFDFLGRGAFVLRAHREGRVGDVRKEIDRQPLEGHVSEDQRSQYQHRDGDGLANGEINDVHGGYSGASGVTILTRVLSFMLR